MMQFQHTARHSGIVRLRGFRQHSGMRKIVLWLVTLALCGGVLGWIISRPPAGADPSLELAGDVEAGRLIFAAAGCASCHIAPGSEKTADPMLAGGKAFKTDFGTFYAPNISTHVEAGIGGWSDADLLTAIVQGVSPAGQYYYPAFPSHAYALADQDDIGHLIAYLRTLPAVDTVSRAHDVPFPFNIRRSLWGWRLLFAPDDWSRPAETPQLDRGRYLVEALGHCGECHTPRNRLGGFQTDRWLAGAARATGEGRVPGLTPAQLDWSAPDIAEYLKSGFTPDYDVVGGDMAEVVANTAQLSDEDRAAIAAYLKALPATE